VNARHIAYSSDTRSERPTPAARDSRLEVSLRGRYDDCRRLAEWLKRDDVLAPDITVRDIADVLCATVSIRSYECLVVERYWTPQRWTRWHRKSLRHLLFATG
jgi:hypothetical protein